MWRPNLFLMALIVILAGCDDDPVRLVSGPQASELAGEFHPRTPTPAEVVAEAYMSDEPLQLGLHSAVPGPVIESGIFAPEHGARLFMATGTNDLVSIPAENAILYQHLTGDATLSGLAVIDYPFAVHSQLIVDPDGFLGAISSIVPIP